MNRYLEEITKVSTDGDALELAASASISIPPNRYTEKLYQAMKWGLSVQPSSIASAGQVLFFVLFQIDFICHDFCTAVKQVGRRGDVHDLPCAVGTAALSGFSQHFRVHLFQPGGDRIGRRTDNDVDTGFVHCVQYPVDMGIIKITGTGFHCRPGRFCDTDDVNSRFLHHTDIFVQTVTGHIFIIIGNAVIQFFHDSPPCRSLVFAFVFRPQAAGFEVAAEIEAGSVPVHKYYHYYTASRKAFQGFFAECGIVVLIK